MRLALSILASHRPDYFRQMLGALSKCDGLGEWRVSIFLDNPDGETVRLAMDFSTNAYRRGVGSALPAHSRIAISTFDALSLAAEGSDFVVHLEEDCVPDPRFLVWMAAIADGRRDDPTVFAASGYRRDTISAGAIERVPHFVPWGWGTWADRLDEMLSGWDFEGGQWDVRVQELRADRVVLFPYRPLVTNIGRIGTTPAEVYDRDRIGATAGG